MSANRKIAGLAATVAILISSMSGLLGATWRALDDPNALGPRPAAAEEAPPVESSANASTNVNGHAIPTAQTFIEGDCSTLFVMAMEAGWTWNEWPKLARIMKRESGCHSNPWGPNDGGHSYGLLQIHTKGRLWTNPIGWGEHRSLREMCGLSAKTDLLNPAVNLRCGRLLFEVRGWRPWS